MPRSRKLVNLDVEETSGVDRAAHLHDGFLVMKNASHANRVKTQLLEALGKSKEDNLSNQEQIDLAVAKAVGEYEEKVATLEAALSAAQAQAADLAAKLEEIASMKQEEESVEAGYDMDKGEMEMTDEVEMAMSEMPEDMKKSIRTLPKEQVEIFAKAFKSQREEIAKAAEEIRKERDSRLDIEAIAKSKETFAHVGIDHDAVAPALRRLALVDGSLAKAVENVLAAAEGQLAESGLLKEMGTVSTSTPSVLDEATALAKSLVENGSVKTVEQGIEKVLDSNPDLAKRYFMEANR